MIDDPKISERAHQLWEQAGRPEGQSDTYWYQAREQLETEQGSSGVDTDESTSGDLESGADQDQPESGSNPAPDESEEISST